MLSKRQTEGYRFRELPRELQNLGNWIAWRKEKRGNRSRVVRETKVPYNARTGKRAKSNDPNSWSSFEEALATFERGGYDGIGFCLSPPYVGVDLDGCCLPDGSFEPWAKEILSEVNSYAELSPNNGVHILATGKLPDGPRQKDFKDREHHGVGMYDAARGRYLTMTGRRINENDIVERTGELHRIHARLFPPKPEQEAKARPAPNVPISDEDLIARARKANDGGKFARLWDAQWEGEYPSPSEADLALCVKLAFWTDRDAARMDALFRRSGLMRDKWKRDDYRQRTLDGALKLQTETHGDWKPPQDTITLDASAVEPSLQILNALAPLHGRIQFKSVFRRGPMILALTETDQQIIWATMTDLTSFARARAAIAEGADVLLPQPPRNKVSAVWDPVAAMIIKLAARDAIRVPHALKAEAKDLLILMWRYAKQPVANNSHEFMKFLIDISQAVRGRPILHQPGEPERPAPPCVFTAEGFCWVHLPTFRNWISLPALTNRLYPLTDIRQGLLLLAFEHQKDVTRGHDGDSESASLWRGPIDVLLE